MKNLISLTFTILLLTLITTLTVLYSDGYRLNTATTQNTNETGIIVKTGMLAVRSIPEGAKIYINDNEEAITATDDTIPSLKPGKYKIRLEKEGFETWEKEVEVFSELVTDITSVLVLRSPKLEPLTNTDVRAFDLSSDQNKIAFITRNEETPGVWVLGLTGNPINLIKTDARVLIADNIFGTPSLGEDVKWSPDNEQVLVKMNENGYLVYDITTSNTSLRPTNITDIKLINEEWQIEWKENFLSERLIIIKNQGAPEWLIEDLQTVETTWSPDFDKLFYIKNDGTKDILTIYNMDDPLPVGEKRINQEIILSEDSSNIESKTSIYWYSDSYHLILVEKKNLTEDYYTISLIRIDGSNKTSLYDGILASNKAYPNPYEDKIVVLTSLKENSPKNLYAIAIR